MCCVWHTGMFMSLSPSALKEGRTPLHIAALEGKPECVRALAALVRCEVDRKDQASVIALYQYCKQNKTHTLPMSPV